MLLQQKVQFEIQHNRESENKMAEGEEH